MQSEDCMVIDSPPHMPGAYISEAQPKRLKGHDSLKPVSNQGRNEVNLTGANRSISEKVVAMLPFGVGNRGQNRPTEQSHGANYHEKDAIELNDKIKGLREENANLRRGIKKRDNQIADHERELRMQNQDILEYERLAKAEIERLREQLKNTTQSNREVHGSPETSNQVLKTKLDIAEKEIGRLQDALEECKDKIFDMQPDQHMSDAQIRNHYGSYCESVGDWVDSTFQDAGGLLVSLKDGSLSTQTVNNLLKYLPLGALDLVQRYPVLDSILLEGFLHGIIYEKFFNSQDHFPGLPMGIENFLNRAEQGLKRLEAHSETNTTTFWPTKAYEALMQDQGFQRDREAHLVKLGRNVENAFKKLLSKTHWPQLDGRKLLAVITQAADLTGRIDSVSTSYTWVYMFDPESSNEVHVLKTEDWDMYTVIDAETGRTIRGQSAVKSGKDGCFGHKLCTISPALIREEKDKQKDLVLVKQSILVKLENPLARSAKRKAGEMEGGP